jgi:hypothetical protein
MSWLLKHEAIIWLHEIRENCSPSPQNADVWRTYSVSRSSLRSPHWLTSLLIAARNEFDADFSWLSLYTQESSLKCTIPPHVNVGTRADLIPAFSSPIDLRTVNIPLHMQLSPASAGLPGDDAVDISIVRENWIYNKAIEEASTGSSARLLYVH